MATNNAINTGIPTAELIFPPSGLAASGNYLVQSLAANGNQNYTFIIPGNFRSLVSAGIVGFATGAGAVGAGKSVTAASSFALVGQNNTTNAQSNTQSITIPAVNTFFEINVAAVLSGIVAGQFGGIKLTHNSIGGAVGYLYLRLIYRQA